MTTIHCEHCGPTRVDRHDTKCPTQRPLHFDEDPGDAMEARYYQWPSQGHVGENFAATPYPPSPAVIPSPHKTTMGRHGPTCACGYNPRHKHPAAEPGQLFAYIGQHIRAVNDATR